MNRRAVVEIDTVNGKGTLSSDDGATVPVSYTLRAFQHVWEQAQMGGTSGIARGTYVLSGALVLLRTGPPLAFENELTLVLDDETKLRILVTRTGVPGTPCPFEVADAGAFTDRYSSR